MWNEENLIKVLKEGGVAIMPTDTIYGMVGKAENESTVNRIYAIRKRNPNKPCIVLIGNVSELEKFSVFPTEEQKNRLEEFWPGSVSIILDCPNDSFAYLHRSTKTLAFRLPVQKSLQNLLKETGPLIAPSANPESLSPAKNIAEAKEYFGNLIDLYVDGGEITNKHSKLIKLHKDGSITILRE